QKGRSASRRTEEPVLIREQTGRRASGLHSHAERGNEMRGSTKSGRIRQKYQHGNKQVKGECYEKCYFPSIEKTGNCVNSPNGMAIKGRSIYFTDLDMKGFKKKVNIDTKEVSLIHQRCAGMTRPFSFFDDLTTYTATYGNDTYEMVIVADYTKNSILIFQDTDEYKAEPYREEEDLGIAHPSSVRISSANDIFPGAIS
ncbi:MAG: hypothetical protein GY749_32605, partial [Desulfobacteraceae bacterium]|nr:hypothetical protein [Desulfobacteraceae bacterium]